MYKRILLILSFAVMGISDVVFATGNIKIAQGDQGLSSALEPHCSLCESVFGGGPGSLKSLKNKAKENVQSLLKKLSSLGYFDAFIDLDIDKNFPFKVTFIVNAGEPFKTASFDFSLQDPVIDQLRSLIPPLQTVFSFSEYEALRKKMESFLKRQGYAEAKIDLPELHVDYEQKTVTPVYPVHLGKIYIFGDYEIEGKPEDLNIDMIQRRLFWKKGDLFDLGLLDQSQEEISDLQIFSIASIDHEQADVNSQKIKIKLKEGKHQTVSFVVRYFSQERFGGIASWKHRNIFGNAEQFDVSAKHSQTGGALIGTFVKPDIFASTTHKLFTQVGKIVSDQFAYSTDLLKVTGGLKYKFSKTLSASSLFTMEHNLESSPVWDNLRYLSFGIKHDTRDSTSDPTKGWLSSFDTTPYFSEKSGQVPVQLEFQQTAYVPFDSVIYGVNFRVGTFANTPLKDVLKHKQYFGGGDGSIRGYGPQSLTVGGFKKQKDDWIPEMGALSKLELTQELRMKVNEDFGMVGFVDFGVFSKNVNPFQNITWMKETGFQEQESLLSCSAGIGFNYLSMIGPVRFDVAFPVVRRKIDDKFIDDNFEFYIRFGQGF